MSSLGLLWRTACMLSLMIMSQAGAFTLPGQSVTPPLPMEEAFVLQAEPVDDVMVLRWNIAQDHYLYKDKLKINGEKGPVAFALPPAETTTDPYFGSTQIYQYQLDVMIPSSAIKGNSALTVVYMGCAKAGLCYPEAQAIVPVPDVWQVAVAETETAKLAVAPPQSTVLQEKEMAPSPSLSWVSLLGFFALGLGLAFTPCVFPMYPILTGIIVGQKGVLSSKQAIVLSLSYVQGMAITYAVVGLIVASVGAQVQAYLQHPLVLILSCVVFVLLSLSMFGVLNFSLPSRWQEKVNALSDRQKSGRVAGVFVMGVLSGLIASPCTTAPLSAALIYVAQSGDLITGFMTLYFLSIGMGLPLFILGSSGGKWLPKPGAWMNMIKHIFGFVLLLVPIVLLERLLPFVGFAALLSLWLIALCLYVTMQAFKKGHFGYTACSVLFSQIIVAGLVVVNVQYWQAPEKDKPDTAVFEVVGSVVELQSRLGNSDGRPVLLDLYADWCVACKEFEFNTFPAQSVQSELKQRELIKIDMTKMTPSDRDFMKKHGVLGLPTLMLFSPDGQECAARRVSGYMPAEQFAQHLEAATQEQC